MRSISTAIAAALLATAVGTAAAAQGFGDALDEEGYLPIGAVIAGETAVVVEVDSGDTIKVDRGSGLIETVHYIGIDAPDLDGTGTRSEPFGQEAAEANEELVGDRTVILQSDISDTDREGRLLRYVWLETDDGILLVNNELVRRGLAEVEANAPNTRHYGYMSGTEASAQADEIGLWSSYEPVVTPAPTRGPVDTSLRTFDPDFTYRWLDGSEYECRQANGCWGLVVTSGRDCSRRMEVDLTIRDERGALVEDLTKLRRSVRRGAEERFKVVPTIQGAYRATVVDIRCLQRS
jgi:micrococcal nuclease